MGRNRFLPNRFLLNKYRDFPAVQYINYITEIGFVARIMGLW
jgi:hypothetical protein